MDAFTRTIQEGGIRMTQKQAILQYIKDFGGITSMEAYLDLGITQLGARIFELKEMGYSFDKTTIKRQNRYGKKIAFSKYSLRKEK